MKRNPFILIAISLVLISTSLPLSGQSEFGTQSIFSQVATLEMRNVGSKSYKDINGSPYYSDDFRESTIYFKDGNFANVPLRWDVFRDEMEFSKDNKIQWLIKKNVNYIRFGADTVILNAAEGDTARPNYYLLKDNGEIKLFYRKVAKYYPYIKPQGYADAVPDRFLPEDNIIFLMKGNDAPVRIITKKHLTKFFSGNETALKFIKADKTRADDVDDLHVLISYLKSR